MWGTGNAFRLWKERPYCGYRQVEGGLEYVRFGEVVFGR